MTPTADTPELPSSRPDAAQARAKRRVTWVGLLVNLPLALGKIVTGWTAGSQALVADGVHSLADLASDVTVLWALKHSARGPDSKHPYGHGRFETLATLAVAAALALAAVGILFDAGARLLAQTPAPPPTLLALAVAGLSLLLKEALYHLTVRVGRVSGSALVVANAWHHRSDALSSVVAALGIAGGMAGLPLFDPLAAAVIAAMLLRVAWSQGRPAVHELVDTQATEEDTRAIARVLRATPGVTGLRALRVRQHGNALSADASLLVDPEITVTEGHRISEAAHSRAVAAIRALDHIVLHIEPDGHAEGFGAMAAPLRAEIEQTLRGLLGRHWPAITLREIRLGYFDEGINVDLVAHLCDADRPRQSQLEAEITRHMRAAQPAVARVNLHCVSE
ncbi:cation diffusion facilitator family transporter [Alkalilacustris brevis]|uniref:cation diffusion facilitator family transporter n=1 Tax=Alkalilacustris brevis TaxID=2026338 RepID=UPI00138FA0A1|nr:cation diffusion facilitator family transporter [Alkalilacustris brevis]